MTNTLEVGVQLSESLSRIVSALIDAFTQIDVRRDEAKARARISRAEAAIAETAADSARARTDAELRQMNAEAEDRAAEAAIKRAEAQDRCVETVLKVIAASREEKDYDMAESAMRGVLTKELIDRLAAGLWNGGSPIQFRPGRHVSGSEDPLGAC